MTDLDLHYAQPPPCDGQRFSRRLESLVRRVLPLEAELRDLSAVPLGMGGVEFRMLLSR